MSNLCQSFADFRDNSGSLGVSTASWAWDSALIEGPKGTPGTPGTRGDTPHGSGTARATGRNGFSTLGLRGGTVT